MSAALKPSAQLLIKLGSLVVHYQELTSPGGHPFDQDAINTILADPEVKAWFAEMDRLVLLPKKRTQMRND